MTYAKWLKLKKEEVYHLVAKGVNIRGQHLIFNFIPLSLQEIRTTALIMVTFSLLEKQLCAAP